MSIFGVSSRGVSAPELQQLENMAKASRNVPEPYAELSLAYLTKVNTPPNWDPDHAKKAMAAFQKATTIAAKHDPSQVAPIRDRFIEMAYEAATAYRMYHDTQPDLKSLEAAIWLLEQLIPELDLAPRYKAQVENLLGDCWFHTTVIHEQFLVEDETEGENRLKLYITAAERAMKYADPKMRPELDAGVAGMQIAAGIRYAERARKSSVLNRPDGNLLNINDREHKDYAKLAIRLAREGRARLEPYPTSEDHEAEMAAANEVIAVSYLTLHNLTWAHSKMAKAIKILQEAVKVVPGDADLWNGLGHAYEQLAEETIAEMTKSYNRGVSATNALGMGRGLSGSIANALGSGIARGSINLKVRSIEKKAAECFAKARQLAPDDF
jgi:tetratricopeptide (TPR) repeat protein